MKSGVAAMVAAATANKADGVGIFLTTDEEGIALSGTKHFVEWWQAQKHPPIPHTLVAEPTCDRVFGDSIKIGRRGSLTGRLRVHGDQQHAAYAHRGANAAHRLINALHEIITATAANITAQAAGKSVTTFQVIDLRGGVGADNVTPPLHRRRHQLPLRRRRRRRKPLARPSRNRAPNRRPRPMDLPMGARRRTLPNERKQPPHRRPKASHNPTHRTNPRPHLQRRRLRRPLSQKHIRRNRRIRRLQHQHPRPQRIRPNSRCPRPTSHLRNNHHPFMPPKITPHTSPSNG